MKTIPLTQGKIAIVDDEDYCRINQYKWFAHNTHGNLWYAERNQSYVNGKRSTTQIKMHRVILNLNDNLLVDHIDGNGLNNQKSNLRIVTMRQNQQNQHRISRYSIYPGTTWSKQIGRWVSHIEIDGKTRHLGSFSNELDAATTYRVACVVLFGYDPHCDCLNGGGILLSS